MNKNLKPYNMRTKEEQRELVVKGGIASGKARRKKKELRERIAIGLEYITNLKAKEMPEEKEIIKEIGYDTFVILKEVMGGNLQAIDRAWDRLYGKPQGSLDVTTGGDKISNTREEIKHAFNELQTNNKYDNQREES
jgi:hypothetical protein